MGTATTTIPIRHSQMVYSVETTHDADTGPQDLTLLELIEAIGEVTNDEREIVATAVHMLVSGRVRLCGSFREEPIEEIVRSCD